MAAITLNIAGNTRQLDRDIQKTVNRVYAINLKTKGDQPLGRITGQVNEFNKSLDASNARVIAFGASAGIIFGVERAFSALVSATIDVQKSLQDINVILNASAQNLQKFGAELFSIARNTGQSFQEVAKAATEFSRQGLGVEETLRRTNEALILSRLSGLDAAKSVEALTAAVNSYANQAVTATEVVNKFANVDAAFAVSSADLAEALQRVGSSASQSGVSLNELIAIVTSAQQTTARGGAVIGNSFKTIFTRLQRGKVVDLLESLGVSSTDNSGQIKSTIQLLQDLANVYDNLGTLQQAAVAERVGGVFQINILKAALGDLSKEYSIYNSALNVAAGTTDQAIRRNEELNKTYAAQINALKENARQLAASGGERLLGPSINRLVGGSNQILEGINESDGQNIGTVLGKGILDGLGQFIAGPGLALIGGVLLKLFRDLGKFAVGSFQQLLGLNTAATQQRDLQASISQILAKNPQLIQLALQGEQGLNQAANQLLASLQKQTVELQKQAQVAAQISKAFIAQAGVRVVGGVPTAPVKPGKASGYIPNFASGKDKMAETIGAYQAGYQPGRIFSKRLFDGQGGSFMATVNSAESIDTVVGPNGNKGTFVTPPNAAKGYVPNFARDQFTISGITAKEPLPNKINKISDKEENSLENEAKNLISSFASKYTNTLQPLGRSVSQEEIKKGFNTVAGAKGALNGLIGSIFEVGITSALDYRAAAREKGGDFDVRGGNNLGKIQELFGISTPLADFKVNAGAGNVSSFIQKILNEEGAGKFDNQEQQRNAQLIVKKELKSIDKKEAARLGIVGPNGKGIPGKDWFPSGTGRGFDLRQKFPGGPEVRARAQKIFNEKLQESKGRFGYLNTEEFRKVQTKGTPGQLEKGSIEKPAAYWAAKYGYLVPPLAKPGGGTPINYTPSKKNAAKGYVPNFELNQQINDAVNREILAGVPESQIYLAEEKALKNANPMGIGVFNKRDEPNKKTRKDAMRRKGFASGYVPNFALEDPDTKAADTASSLAALAAQVTAVGFAFQFSKNEYAEAIQKFTQETGKTAGALKKFTTFLRTNALGLSIAAPIIAETIANAIGKETAEARRTSSAVSAAGQIGSFAATGALIAPGPVGAGIGAAVGALLTLPTVIEDFVSEVPELKTAAIKAQESLTKINDSGSAFLRSFENYQSLLEKGASQDVLDKAQQEYSRNLFDLSDEYRNRLSDAAKLGKAQEELAKILEEEAKRRKGAETALGLGASIKDLRIEGLNPFDFETEGLDIGTEEGKKRFDKIFSTLSDELTFGKTNQEIVELSRNLRNLLPKDLIERIKSGDIADAITASESASPFAEPVNLEEIKQIYKGFIDELVKTGAVSQEGGEQLSNFTETFRRNSDVLKRILPLLNLFEGVFDNIGDKAQSSIDATNGDQDATNRYLKSLEEARSSINRTVEAIQTNIQVQNLWKSAIDRLNESSIGFENTLKISDKFTNPQALVESIIGQGSDFGRRLEIGGNLATIEESQRSAISNAAINFSETILSAIEGVSQKNIDKLVEDLTKIEESLGKDPDKIQAEADKKTGEILQEEKKLNQSIGNVENLISQFVSDQIDSQRFLQEITSSLDTVGINIKDGSISSKLETALAKFNIDQISEAQKAFQQRKTLAKESTQKIVQQKIAQSLGAFGGAEEFLNPTEGGLIFPIEAITKSIEPLTRETFRSIQDGGARKNVTVDLGKESLRLITGLRTLSGGAFRADAPGEAFNRAVSGRAADIQNQLSGIDKLIAQQAKIGRPGDLARAELEAFKRSIESLGGAQNISELQIAQAAGSLSEKKFAEIVGRFQSTALEQLKKIDPQLAELIAETTDLSTNDPSVKSLTTLNTTQARALRELEKINKNLSSKGRKKLDLKDSENIESSILEAKTKGAVEPVLSPYEIETKSIRERDQRLTGLINPQAILDRNLSLGPNISVGEQDVQAEIQRALKPLNEFGVTLRPLSEITSDISNASYSMDVQRKGLYSGDLGREVERRKLEENPLLTLDPVSLTTRGPVPLNPYSPEEIEKRTTEQRDSTRFEELSRNNGIGMGPLSEKYNLGGLLQKILQTDKVDATLSATKAFGFGVGSPSADKYYADQVGINNLLNPQKREYSPRDAANLSLLNPFGSITYDRALNRAQIPTNISTQPAAAQQSFAKQEATVSTNTSALIELGTKIETLSSDLNNKEQAGEDEGTLEDSFSVVQESLSNNSTAVNALTTNVQTLNASINTLVSSINELNIEPTAGTNQTNTPQNTNATTPPTTIGPFNTVVTPAAGGDFNKKIEEAINRLRSEIYGKLEIKTPPIQR
jgi:TP901 family phage tail tape measure protein